MLADKQSRTSQAKETSGKRRQNAKSSNSSPKSQRQRQDVSDSDSDEDLSDSGSLLFRWDFVFLAATSPVR